MRQLVARLFFFVSVHVPFVSLAFVLMWYVSRVFVSPEGCLLSCFHDYGVTSTVMYLHGSGSFFDSYFWECKSDMLSLHKISFGSAIASLIKLRFQNLLLHSLALSLHKISCTRQSKSKLSLRSFALSLQKTCCTREAGIKKLSVCSRHL